MGSKKRYSVRWRLLLPIVLSMFTLVSLMVAFQYHHERELREDNINHILNFITNRIMAAHEKGMDIKPFFNFMRNYYDKSSFDDIRLSVYDQDGNLIDAIGREFKTPENITNEASTGPSGAISSNARKEIFYYRVATSTDGKITVHAAMPWNESINNMLQTNTTTFLIILLVALSFVVVMAYVSTNFIVNNLNILKEFARLANNPNMRVDDTRLGRDELGDISREIIRLYRGRVKAMEASEKEHAVAVHAIEEKRRVQHQLTNNINHELKTPVGVIRGYLETVLTSDDMDEDTKRYFLTRALSNVERLCALLNDVSTMTRLEEGSGKIIFSEINFHDFIYSINDDMMQSGTLKDMTFDFDIPLKCTVIANQNLLTSAITNLIRNATIHSHGTEMGIKIVAESDKFYTFAFWDNGQGVPDEHVPHLFERFYRVEAGRSRKSGGTGLGLPIVKSTIESLGGAISVYNRTTGGLEFLFTLKKAV
ncbi:MAG: HAMP domain-containing histidine kinase [Firmicutes bacterium]|nr:HAMP domain-containing histidine kinase [Bacillota bacterium]MCM1401359.1 HAMP domain-containing histidine kinase [Bacteroides sp.]MCM1477384.1 HAMP domain-containing histidine kinase [Bacteroides sp.]